MNPFDFSSPATLKEALALLGPEARPLGGGTDLLALMKNGVVSPALLVSLQDIAGFVDRLFCEPDVLRVLCEGCHQESHQRHGGSTK